eukprot:8987400-Alexandrium_andersonii.AAC.1
MSPLAPLPGLHTRCPPVAGQARAAALHDRVARGAQMPSLAAQPRTRARRAAGGGPRLSCCAPPCHQVPRCREGNGGRLRVALELPRTMVESLVDPHVITCSESLYLAAGS